MTIRGEAIKYPVINNRKTLKRELRRWQAGGTDPRSKMSSYEARSLFRRCGWPLNYHA